ncbi:hypothetical protein CK516_02625 [Nostoc sp. 'Peltigera malacea cyanobiont' DB3992]|nr:hypothetical protein CK516_02625 [Nostoc sp. 'Peltigera malacea cyanobiont' DB3992]
MSPLPKSGEGIKGWGAMTVVSITNYADMISGETMALSARTIVSVSQNNAIATLKDLCVYRSFTKKEVF